MSDDTELFGKDQEDPIMSGSFFLVDGKMVSDIRLEFNTQHKDYMKYLYKLKKLIKECEQEHILLSSSGI